MKRIKKLLILARDFILDLDFSDLFLYRLQSKINGLTWDVNQDDPDTWPSIPHLHATEKPYKLDIYTGRIFNINTKKHVLRASRKGMEILWTDKKAVAIILYNRNKYKDRELPDIPDYAVKLTCEEVSAALKQHRIILEDTSYAE